MLSLSIIGLVYQKYIQQSLVSRATSVSKVSSAAQKTWLQSLVWKQVHHARHSRKASRSARWLKGHVLSRQLHDIERDNNLANFRIGSLFGVLRMYGSRQASCEWRLWSAMVRDEPKSWQMLTQSMRHVELRSSKFIMSYWEKTRNEVCNTVDVTRRLSFELQVSLLHRCFELLAAAFGVLWLAAVTVSLRAISKFGKSVRCKYNQRQKTLELRGWGVRTVPKVWQPHGA